ncbi:hypothetical protein [Exiguobacterium aurantiacum]|uniref:DUF3139 domain-containing protein n=1 Tax=Exiguobacterium aurantiacum TaxID=33987 RepID=A0ABY5FNR1_9BACL|nr:hypothetical protein [Exiguobacterium aurantiacum]UTT43191.1 hypothetical protein NMQ00_01445 [Exiguobacterium aurantiacum]
MPKRNWETIFRTTLVVTITLATFLYVRYSTEIEERERALEQHLATHYNISTDTYSIDGTLSLSGYVYDLTFEDEPDAAYTFQVEQAADGHRVKFEQADGKQPARVATFAP